MKCAAIAGLLLSFGTPPARAQEPPVVIESIVSLTGSGAFLGREQADAMALAADYLNKTGGVANRKVIFNVRDDQSSPQVAVQLFGEALQRKPQVVIGSSLVAGCSAIAPLLNNGPVVYCLSSGMRPAQGSYMFAYGSSTADIMHVLGTYLRNRGMTRIAAIFPTDASGQDGEHSLERVLSETANRQLKLVAQEHFNGSDVSVSAQLTRIKAADPQIVIAWGTGSPLGTVLRSANDIGLTVPFAASAANLNYAVMRQFAGFLPHDLFMVTVPGVVPDAVGPGPLKSAALSFYRTVSAAGKKPDANMVTAWDPAMLVTGALRTLGPDASAARIRAYLSTLHSWYGAAGQYDFRDGSQRGLSASTMLVVHFDGAHQVFVPVSGIGGVPLRP